MSSSSSKTESVKHGSEKGSSGGKTHVTKMSLEDSSSSASTSSKASGDTGTLQQIIAETEKKNMKKEELRLEKEKALKAVVVDRSHVEFLWKQCDLTIPQADRLLRQNGGSIDGALKAFIDGKAAL
jgi:hypothetical protein